jgi:hypothetical protein
VAGSCAHRLGSLLLACIVAATPFAGCSTVRMVPMTPGILEARTKAVRPPGQRIVGYTTTDGVHHKFDGWVQLLGGDLLRFRATPRAPGDTASADSASAVEGAPESSFVLPRDQVAVVDARQTNSGRTTVLVVSLTLLAVTAFLVIAVLLSGPYAFGPAW